MAVCLIITTAGHQTGSDVPPSFALLFAGHTAGHAGIFRDWRRSQDTGSVVDRWGQKLVSQMGFLSLCACVLAECGEVQLRVCRKERRSELPRDLIDPLISLLSKEHLLLL